MGIEQLIRNFFPLIMVAVLFAMYYFMLLRPTKKRDMELKKMRDSLQAGDRVITIGGIVGRIISTKEETVVIETGADKTKLQFTKWAISQKENSSED